MNGNMGDFLVCVPVLFYEPSLGASLCKTISAECYQDKVSIKT